MTDPRIHARRVKVQRQRGRRRLSVVLGVLLVAGIAAGTVAVLHSSLFGARTIVIAGAVRTDRDEILKTTGLDREPPLVDVNTAGMQHRLERLPWVATASVRVDWPSTVTVALVERVPVATARSPVGTYVLLDATGRVLADQAARPAGLPLVSLPGGLGPPGSSLGASARSVLAAAAALPVSLRPRVEEIVAAGADGVVVRLTDGMTALVGNDQALAQKFVSLATVLRRVNLEGVGAIDLRVPATPVLTPLVRASNVHAKGDG
jgi:cell division protein FtsQ